jgi:gluconolactonase
MTFKTLLGFVVAALLAVPAGAREITVVPDVLGPEGPLFIEGNLYFVGWSGNYLSKWDGKKVTVLNEAKNCGHNGLALTAKKTFLIACTNDPGAIIETDMSGNELRRWETDSDGNKLAGGINDIVVTANGGAYATVFGAFEAVPAGVTGRILYLAPGSSKWVEVAGALNYANGVGVSPDQKTLYVSQTVGNSILKFTIKDDGTLTNRANFAMLNVLDRNRIESWYIGPDSMKIDSRGNMYVAQWNGGKVFKISPAGKLRHVFRIKAGVGTTNVAFGPGEKDLYVSVVKNTDDPTYRGRIVRIPNVK